MKHIFKITSIVILILISGCKKQFLDSKPDDSLVVPEGLADMQAILDYDQNMNGSKNQYGPDPSVALSGADDYYIPDAQYLGLTDYSKAVYIWAKNIPWGSANKNWEGPYRTIFYANSALDGINKINPAQSERVEYNNIKGSALFYRSYQFYNIAQVFAKPYNANTVASDLGIPLRLTADISVASTRATLKESYDRIIGDLNEALPLLPNKPLLLTRPSRPAAFAELARVYLTMGDFNTALKYCDSCLKIYNVLLDYNKISATLALPFPVFNAEVLYHSKIGRSEGNLVSPSVIRIDSSLYNSYSSNDLRKGLFFKVGTDGKATFKGSYSGTGQLFSGIATDEIILMQAECYARLNDVPSAMSSLNILLKNRYKSATFIPVTAINSTDALNQILVERRKELVMRTMRWVDLRRLNQEGKNIVVQRKVQGTFYTLAPNEMRYTWPIPDDVIGLTNIQQNPR